MDIITALKKPFSDIKTLIIGIILMLITPINLLIIPGYLLRLASNTMKGDDKLPKFDNFVELVKDSIYVILLPITLISIIMIIPIIQLLILPMLKIELEILEIEQILWPWLINNLTILISCITIPSFLTFAKTKDIVQAINIPKVIMSSIQKNFIISIIVAGIIYWIVTNIITISIAVIFGAPLGFELITKIFSGAFFNSMNLFYTDYIPKSTLILGAISIVSPIVTYIMSIFLITLIAKEYK